MSPRRRGDTQEPIEDYHDTGRSLEEQHAEGRRIREDALESWRRVWRSFPREDDTQ
ncbi:hypothetical protein [Kocuria marina]|uniref:hypothetical protein n=1 Tax=Kocuria marina TaxID=223184 RepID=UPI000AD053CE|nr:hypothetical protein [Kocuria marina]